MTRASLATRTWAAGEAAVVVGEPEAGAVEAARSEVEAAEGAKVPDKAAEEVKEEPAGMIGRGAFQMIWPG